MNYSKPVPGFAACSGTGKTTPLKQLIPLLVQKGVPVGAIKQVPYTRIELHRPSLGHSLRYPQDVIIAMATDAAIETDDLPRLDINDACGGRSTGLQGRGCR